MIKNAMKRGINSFMYSVAITTILSLVVYSMASTADSYPVLPAFAERFSKTGMAFLVQLVLIGMTSAAFGAFSVIMESERIGLLTQSILYFILTAAFWLPTMIFCFNIQENPASFFTVTLSYVLSYVITWGISYKNCKKNIDEINKHLIRRGGKEQNGICN